MKILHYLHGLPPVRGGGLIRYALDLAEGEQKASHDIQLLVPGQFCSRLKAKTEILSGIWENFTCHYIINPLPVTEGKALNKIDFLFAQGDEEVYIRFLQRICPDIIHMHTFMGIHLSFMQAAERLKIPIVFTTHDYYGLCPKINLLRGKEICHTGDCSKCADCLGKALSVRKVKWKHSDIYRALKCSKIFQVMEYSQTLLPYKKLLRDISKGFKKSFGKLFEKEHFDAEQNENITEKYELLYQYYQQMLKRVTCFHFNSLQSQEVYESYLGNVRGEVIPVTNRMVRDYRKKREYHGKLKIGYLSSGQAFKGYEYLKESLDEMYRAGMTEFECHIYFNSKDMRCPYIIGHAPYDEEEMEAVYRNLDVLVLPSLWKETFGMVVLEALSYGVPVVVSSHVGAKELLEENPGMGIVIDIDKDKNSLKRVLKEIYYNRNMLDQMNKRICEWDYEWNFEEHVVSMLELYKMLY